ncbi:hypothetical protein BSYN_26690 [Bacteroides sedimenti]|uniref:Uncharacterized protein n=1 Tax=Bacteroides sedimenti TaxID=2136147 RepID=A0ABN6ZEB1_9BACE
MNMRHMLKKIEYINKYYREDSQQSLVIRTKIINGKLDCTNYIDKISQNISIKVVDFVKFE